MTLYESAMIRLRTARDALNALDLAAASALLAEHDREVRHAFQPESEASGLAPSEIEALHAAQAELLSQMQAVQQGVIEALGRARSQGSAARAYLGHADE